MIERPRTPAWAWFAVAALTAGLIVWNAEQSLRRYRELNSGWSWDLAYYNQWFRALTQGDGKITVRPSSWYGREGESIWNANYLMPIRLVIAPFYAIRPGPETLLVVEAVVFWLVVPAAFVLAKGESGSVGVGLTAAALVPLTPLFGPLAANDFRELQMALPAVLLALEGVRGRRPWLALAGVVAMLACRQETAILVASLAVVPPRTAEDLGRTVRWARALVLAGVVWTLVFLVYLAVMRIPQTPRDYLLQFVGEKAPLGQAIPTAAEFLLLGLGSWGVVAWGVPRVAVLVLPWAWMLATGRWSLRYLGTEQWHHVRYAAPLASMGVAAGVLGFARLSRRDGPLGLKARVGLVTATALGLAAGRVVVDARLALAPRPVSRDEAARLWPWIERVGPDDAVLADYAVAAPLSSRKTLYSYTIPSDRPYRYPDLEPEIRWVFARDENFRPDEILSQGFNLAHRDETLAVYQRPGASPGPTLRRKVPPVTGLPLVLRLFAIADRRAGVVIALAVVLGWPWFVLRRRWLAASGSPVEPSGSDVALALLDALPGTSVAIVSDSPRDLADPARGTLRLARSTADGHSSAAATLAAIETAHLRIRPGLGRAVAGLRLWLVVGARLGSDSAWLALALGLAVGNATLFDLGLVALAVASVAPLALYPIERAAARLARGSSPEIDPRLLSALPWRHVVEAVPISWRTTVPQRLARPRPE